MESPACVTDSFFSSENGQNIGQVKHEGLQPADADSFFIHILV